MKRAEVRGCVMSIGMLCISTIVAGILWLFRKQISLYFFSDDAYAGLVGLLFFAVVPMFVYIGLQLISRLE